MPVISIYNQAGGAGKTTLAYNLGYHLARRDLRTLAIDLDHQANLTRFALQQVMEDSAFDALINDGDLPIMPSSLGYDVVPAAENLAKAEMLLTTIDYKESRLKEAIERIQVPYDFVLIDCPPSLGNLSVNALAASTHLLVPIATSYKGIISTDALLATAARIKKRGNRNLKFAGFVPNRYRVGVNHEKDILSALIEQCSPIARVYPPLTLANAIDVSTLNGVALAIQDPKHKNVKVFEEITEELLRL